MTIFFVRVLCECNEHYNLALSQTNMFSKDACHSNNIGNGNAKGLSYTGTYVKRTVELFVLKHEFHIRIVL